MPTWLFDGTRNCRPPHEPGCERRVGRSSDGRCRRELGRHRGRRPAPPGRLLEAAGREAGREQQQSARGGAAAAAVHRAGEPCTVVAGGPLRLPRSGPQSSARARAPGGRCGGVVATARDVRGAGVVLGALAVGDTEALCQRHQFVGGDATVNRDRLELGAELSWTAASVGASRVEVRVRSSLRTSSSGSVFSSRADTHSCSRFGPELSSDSRTHVP